MAELFNVRCSSGRLIITDTTITVELGQLKSESLLRSSLSSVDTKVVAFAFFGIGGGSSLTFHGKGGERIHIKIMNTKKAREIVQFLRS